VSATTTAVAEAGAAPADQPPAGATALSPTRTQVTIRHCTLVPGWDLDDDCEPRRPAEASLELVQLQGRVEINHTILGSILLVGNEVRDEPLAINLADSILDATDDEREALSASGGARAHAVLTARRSTVFGTVETHAVDLAENTIFTGTVRVARRQRGCMRFCYVPPGSRTPRRYHCQPDLVERAVLEAPGPGSPIFAAKTRHEQDRVRPRFNSQRYGGPTYAQLAHACAHEIARGADDESEMGAFHDLFQPQRAANLRARLDEYTPAEMGAGVIFAS
jgi:hypothetical protein